MSRVLSATLTCVVAVLAIAALVHGQAKPAAAHRVVLDVTSEGEAQWAGALNAVDALRNAFGADQVEIEVVGHNAGLGMLLAKNHATADRVAKLAALGPGVRFAACRNSMRHQQVTEAELTAGVQTVPSGTAEVVLKQEAGWSYVKTGG